MEYLIDLVSDLLWGLHEKAVLVIVFHRSTCFLGPESGFTRIRPDVATLFYTVPADGSKVTHVCMIL